MTELAPFPTLNDLSVDKLKPSGVVGENRETDLKCQIRASNDLEAVLSWLERYQRTNATYKSYKKEPERLLLWCLHEKRKALSDLDAQDFEDYFSFLQNPPESWCSSNGSKRGRQHSDWRPLVKPLGPASLNITVSIIHSLMDFLYHTSVRNHKPITTRQLYRLLKNFSNTVSDSFSDRHKREKLRRFSPHWLRHLSATQQDKSGMLFKHIQANHRHESENTTRRYVHALDRERHKDMDLLRLFLV